jgi:homoserine O-acetyltransferase/O-succinyltransferase
MAWETTKGVLALGDTALERGGVLRNARLSWQAHGTLNAARDNVVVYPTSYGATADDLTWLLGPEGVLDPERWFVVVPDMFANGRSTSPATAQDYPPLVTTHDNVLAQRRLLTEHFGVDRVAAVYGFSMGAMQAYAWAAAFPDAVERAVVVCGSARTAAHNQVFLSGLLRVLEAAPEHLGGGRFSAEPVAALRAFAHVYAGWGMSQDFYRAGLHRAAFGAADVQEYVKRDWVGGFAGSRAADLYAQAQTWYAHDISAAAHGGDLEAALRSIRARVLLLPVETDLYFRVADNEAELAHLASAELHPVPSIWGHRAGGSDQDPEAYAFLRRAVRAWLDS